MIWNPLRKKRSETVAEGLLRWRFDFAVVQSGGEVLDEASPEDDGGASDVEDSGADTDDGVGGAKMVDARDDAEVSMFTADRGGRLDPHGDEGFVA